MKIINTKRIIHNNDNVIYIKQQGSGTRVNMNEHWDFGESEHLE